MRPRNPLTFAVSKGRLSAPGVIRPAGSPEKNHRTYSSNRQSARVDNGVDAMGGCGFESRCVRFAVACAITRPHHPCEVVCKRKNLGVSPLRPSFIDFSDLFCGPMAYDKPKQVYTATSRRPMFSTQNGQGVPGRETGHSKSTVSLVRLPSHPLRWHNGVSSLPHRVREIHSWQFFAPSRSTPSRTA